MFFLAPEINRHIVHLTAAWTYCIITVKSCQLCATCEVFILNGIIVPFIALRAL